jgi:predicted transcriptional regulator of viral defense system
MKFFDFEQKMSNYPVFSAKEIKVIFHKEENILEQIAFWVKRGYLTKIRKGLYVLTSKKDDIEPMVLANKIYGPSYLSMEFALNYYGIIPDIPGTYTSVSSRKTISYQNDFGKYIYQKIKKDFFTGYVRREIGGITFNLATPEKAILDFIYLNKNEIVASDDYWRELRIDEDFVFNKKEIKKYLKLINKEKIDNLVDSLLLYQKNAR